MLHTSLLIFSIFFGLIKFGFESSFQVCQEKILLSIFLLIIFSLIMYSFLFINLKIMYFGNFMNINLGNQGHPQGFTPMLIGEASPYLSPLHGSLSVISQNSPDQLLDFHLQPEPCEAIAAEAEFLQEQQNPQIFFIGKEGYSEADLIKQQSRMQKSEIQTPASLTKSNHSKVYSIIEFLVLNDIQSEAELHQIGRPLYQYSNNLQFVFKTLLVKFKKLKKTKEEMVKYCMRKAFKFVSELKKSPKSSKSKKQKNQKNHNSDKDLSIQMPFRKNSSQKTMNTHFLKTTFKNKEFLSGYSQFLGSIQNIIEDDNNSKIAYLTETIQKILANSDIKQIQNIKRLPWTKTILNRTQELARTLMEFASMEMTLEDRESQSQNN